MQIRRGDLKAVSRRFLRLGAVVEVSSVAMIDLDQGIRALTDPVRPRWPWGHRSVFISPAQQLFLQAQVHSLQSKRLSYSSLVIFSQGLVGSE